MNVLLHTLALDTLPEGFARDGSRVYAHSAEHGALVDDADALAILDGLEGAHLRSGS